MQNNPRINGKFYKVMFKQDDDCRQDQLVLQMIDLMDDLLKQINYDFKFTVYKVVAFSEKDGMIEFVPNWRTINHILYNYENKIEMFLSDVASKNLTEYSTIFETYLDSWAGYWVVTYLLGIGDRHLDNLLIDESGHLFHVDFGYIFGKNPKNKGLMPPIRICSQMIDWMGGIKSKDYKKFLEKWVNAFLFLRIHSKYILNLLHLMIHAEIVDLPAQNYEETLNQIYMKFLPELKERAHIEQEFSRLIEQSIDQLFARIFEMFHNIGQNIK